MDPKSLIELRRLQMKIRFDWPAVFSTNPKGEIFPFRTYEKIPEFMKVNVRRLSPVLDKSADAYLEVREEGGRFFVNNKGACFKDEKKRQIWFWV